MRPTVLMLGVIGALAVPTGAGACSCEQQPSCPQSWISAMPCDVRQVYLRELVDAHDSVMTSVVVERGDGTALLAPVVAWAGTPREVTVRWTGAGGCSRSSELTHLGDVWLVFASDGDAPVDATACAPTMPISQASHRDLAFLASLAEGPVLMAGSSPEPDPLRGWPVAATSVLVGVAALLGWLCGVSWQRRRGDAG